MATRKLCFLPTAHLVNRVLSEGSKRSLRVYVGAACAVPALGRATDPDRNPDRA